VGARRVFTAACLAAAALVAQSAVALAATSADMAITITGPATAAAGTNFTYTITIQNNGPDPAAGVSFNQGPLPVNTTEVTPFHQISGPAPTPTVPAGTVYVFSWGLGVVPGTAAGTVITKTITVSATTADPNPANNTSTVNTIVTAGAQADLAVTKTADPTAIAGQRFFSHIMVVNNGPQAASTVVVVDTLPAGLTGLDFTPSGTGWHSLDACVNDLAGHVRCTIAAILLGENFKLDVSGIETNPGTYQDTATVSSSTFDPNLANNTAIASTGVRHRITGNGSNVSAVEGASFSGEVATFTDATPNPSAANYTAVITWGDGTSSAGTVVATGPGAFSIRGTHTYLEEGSFSIWTVLTASLNDAVAFTTTATVADAALHPQGLTLPPTRLPAFAGAVATFTDDDPGGVASDYTATINWGDGTTTAGVVSAQGIGFKVSGAHTFGEGKFTITTSIKDAGAPAVVTSMITVDMTPPVTTAMVNGTFKNGRWTAVNPGTLTLTATDNLTGVAATYYTVNGGVPKLYPGPVSLSTGFYVINFWSVDRVGNVEAAHKIQIRVKHRPGEDGDDEDQRGDSEHGDHGDRGGHAQGED
jgi:uncharacterized repeat protein (TIGR01451 family)